MASRTEVTAMRWILKVIEDYNAKVAGLEEKKTVVASKCEEEVQRAAQRAAEAVRARYAKKLEAMGVEEESYKTLIDLNAEHLKKLTGGLSPKEFADLSHDEQMKIVVVIPSEEDQEETEEEQPDLDAPEEDETPDLDPEEEDDNDTVPVEDADTTEFVHPSSYDHEEEDKDPFSSSIDDLPFN
nr:MAG TPA: hypothetical protein [Crassvirales sp.]